MTKPKKPTGSESHERSAWYTKAMEHLLLVVQQLSHVRDVSSITAIVRDAARELTNADGATFVLRDGNQCYYADESAIAPLWKGKRFAMETCVSGWVMLNGEPAVIPDIYADERVPAEAYRPTFVKSMAMVPIRRHSPIGAIGNYWAAPHEPTEEEIAILQNLADATSLALENAALYERLRLHVVTLEQQQQRITSQHDALEVFTRALAHDLKEPLRTLTSFSQLIGAEPDLSERTQRHARFIADAANRMGLLVDNVFQYTQLDIPDRDDKKPCAMRQILRAVEANLARLIMERGAIITSDLLPELPANDVQMMQLLQNLISNAVRHNPLRTSVHIEAKDDGDFWRFSVRDNGNGIESEDLDRIFQPFKRLSTDKECTGLGLAICRKIVSSHAGEIWCESRPGAGSTFYFTLPKSQTIIADTMPATAKSGLLNILLVDDMEADIELTRIMFDEANLDHHFHVARGGAEAIDMLKNQVNLGEPYLLLIDINMPGMSGFELLERVKSDDQLKSLPVIMCTGSVYERDRTRAASLGAAGYLTKPANVDAIKAMLSQVSVSPGKPSKLNA